MARANVILGLMTVGPAACANSRITTIQGLKEFLATFQRYGGSILDTARAYPPGMSGKGEEMLGEVLAGAGAEGFVVDSKVNSFAPGSHSKAGIAKSGELILDALRMKQISVLYLHAPDRATPFEETCSAMNDLYNQGVFKEFGISNFSAKEVSEVVEICTKNSYCLPKIYQGQYNALCRGAEKELFPILRANKIRFAGWSPLAGGMLTGKLPARDAAVEKGGRFDDDGGKNGFSGHFKSMWLKDSIFQAIENLNTLAAQHNLSTAEIVLRWTRHHSILSGDEGDAIIIGASSSAQLSKNLAALEGGPLEKQIVDVVEGLWQTVVDAGESVGYSM